MKTLALITICIMALACKVEFSESLAQGPFDPREQIQNATPAGEVASPSEKMVLPIINHIAILCLKDGNYDHDCVMHVTEQMQPLEPIGDLYLAVREYREGEK